MARARAIIRYSLADGFEIVEESDPKRARPSPSLEHVRPARWGHWYQRQLARVWYAVLLSMNIEPSVDARTAIRELDPERYQIFKDRWDIASTLAGWGNLPTYEGYAKEGERADGQYIALVDFYEFAKGLGWSDLDAMREGLKIETRPPVLPSPKLTNSLLILLHEFMQQHVAGFDITKPNASATKVESHFIERELRLPVDDQTIAKYIKSMDDALNGHNRRAAKPRATRRCCWWASPARSAAASW